MIKNTNQFNYLLTIDFCFVFIADTAFPQQILKKKLFQQFVELFKIFEKINNFVYKFEISIYWRFHFVFIRIQLKSILDLKINFYGRQQTRFLSIYVNGDTNAVKNYVIKKIVKSRQFARKKKYLIKWKNYESKNDAWKNIFKMNNVLNFVRKFEEKQIKKNFVFNFKFNFDFIFDDQFSAFSFKTFSSRKNRFKKTVNIVIFSIFHFKTRFEFKKRDRSKKL